MTTQPRAFEFAKLSEVPAGTLVFALPFFLPVDEPIPAELKEIIDFNSNQLNLGLTDEGSISSISRNLEAKVLLATFDEEKAKLEELGRADIAKDRYVLRLRGVNL